MIVTICGSYSKKEVMMECQEFFEELGCIVNNPAADYRKEKCLLEKQEEWIEKIRMADLVVVIPKKKVMMKQDDDCFVHTLGESTSYEVAIAKHFGKTIVLW